MPDAPELPEAKDTYERVIALTIAILAVILAFVDNAGDNAKTNAIVKTTEAANKWAYYQAKSLKENGAEGNAALLAVLTPTDAAAAKAAHDLFDGEAKRYNGEKKELMTEAQDLEKQVARSMAIDDRADEAALLLQVAVVVCSIAILVRWKLIYFAGLVVGVGGIAAAFRALLG